MRLITLIPVMFLSACFDDETISDYGGAGKNWVLTELDDAPFSAQASLQFPETGRIAGNAPCNTYTGSMTLPYPWFQATQIASTKMACPDLAAESLYFEALAAMTISEVLGDIMILSNDDGRKMVFKADD